MTASLAFAWTSIRAAPASAACLAAVAVAIGAIAPSASAASPVAVAACDGPREATATAPGSERFAQTFAPRAAGALTSAAVEVTKPPASSGDWRVEIALAERIPIGTNARAVVAAATVPDATVPVGASALVARFTAPATIGPPGSRHEYELVVTRPGASAFGVGHRAGNDCAGLMLHSGSPNDAFSPFTGATADLVFRVLATDAAPPQTTITAGPRRRTTRRRARFRWRASEPVDRFECKLDRGRFHRCDPPRRVRVRPGRHRFRVRAIDLAGNPDPTPAKRRWRVRR